MKKRLLAVLLTSVMVLSLPAAVFADEESDLRAQREQAYAELSDTESEVDSLEGELREINNEIDDRNADLVTCFCRSRRLRRRSRRRRRRSRRHRTRSISSGRRSVRPSPS